MISTSYLNPAACRRRYEAVDGLARYPLAAIEALANRLWDASEAAHKRGEHGVASALLDRALDLYARAQYRIDRIWDRNDGGDDWRRLQERIARAS